MNENLIGYIEDILDEYKDQEIAKQAGAYEAALYMIKIQLEILKKSNTPESNEKPLFWGFNFFGIIILQKRYTPRSV